MATDIGFIEYVVEQVGNAYPVRYRKMSGEYIVYVCEKPVLLVCNNTIYIKIIELEKIIMITETFDNLTEDIIKTEYIGGKTDKTYDVCIITFSCAVIEKILENFHCEKIAESFSANGSVPFYKINYKGKDIAFFMCFVGAPSVAAFIEEAKYFVGAKKYIMFGSCGCLNREITEGKAIVPTEAYRDEGVSYHYAPAADYIKIENANKIAEAFTKMGIPYVMGKTWTTDAIYRETKGNMLKRKAEGCIAVDMESASAQAVCNFRDIDFFVFFISGDLLDSSVWDRRILGMPEEKDQQLNNFYIALELALLI